MKKIVIVGNGGFAKEVEWIIERINKIEPTWDFMGFIDNDSTNSRRLGDDNYVVHYDNELNVAIAIGNSCVREKIWNQYKTNTNILFPNLIDPSVLISNRVKMGEGNIICAGTIITVDIVLGNFNIINIDCTIGHDSNLENFVTVNPSVNISGNTIIHSGCNIGTGTQIIQGISIGNNSIIGAGAVVVRDLPADCTAVGVPAKVINFHK